MSEETMAVRIPDHSDGHFGPERFIDRELSWLAFNQRVLELAEDPDMHLLDRCNFASIFASNLDEFFMVRVASLKRRIATGLAVSTLPASPRSSSSSKCPSRPTSCKSATHVFSTTF